MADCKGKKLFLSAPHRSQTVSAYPISQPPGRLPINLLFCLERQLYKTIKTANQIFTMKREMWNTGCVRDECQQNYLFTAICTSNEGVGDERELFHQRIRYSGLWHGLENEERRLLCNLCITTLCGILSKLNNECHTFQTPREPIFQKRQLPEKTLLNQGDRKFWKPGGRADTPFFTDWLSRPGPIHFDSKDRIRLGDYNRKTWRREARWATTIERLFGQNQVG